MKTWLNMLQFVSHYMCVHLHIPGNLYENLDKYVKVCMSLNVCTSKNLMKTWLNILQFLSHYMCALANSEKLI